MMSPKNEIFISIDVETSGPIPGEFSMLTLGACVVYDPGKTFVCSFKPISRNFIPAALEISKLSLDALEKTGLDPIIAMNSLRQWIFEQCPENTVPVFVGLNAPFDWSFVNYYFHKFLGDNPFGFTAIDIKALYMGASSSSWHDTRSSAISNALQPKLVGDHDALHDAQYQAELFRLVRAMHPAST